MRPIKHCFNREIAQICNRVIELESLNAKVHAFLPESLRAMCKAGSFNKGILTLVTSDSGVATQLRFLKSELRDNLRKGAGFYHLNTIEVKIMETIGVSNPKKKKIRVMSKQALESMQWIVEKLKE